MQWNALIGELCQSTDGRIAQSCLAPTFGLTMNLCKHFNAANVLDEFPAFMHWSKHVLHKLHHCQHLSPVVLGLQECLQHRIKATVLKEIEPRLPLIRAEAGDGCK
jgi:hypothetical protein